MESKQFFNEANRERKLKEIISLNDHGDYLIDTLKLKELEASPKNKENKDTTVVNRFGLHRKDSFNTVSEFIKKYREKL